MEIQITKMTLQDLNLISDILKTDFDDFWNISTLQSELNNKNSNYFVAKNESLEIIGFAGVWFGFEEAHITNIVTKKSFRHLGIATKLLNCIINYCKEFENIYTLTLEVKESNTVAISLYEKFDFKKVGLRKNYYNNIENAIIMTKDI